MENNQDALGFRKRKIVRIKDEKQILMLRAYLAHPSNWAEIIEDIKANAYHLFPAARTLYITSSYKQLRDRLSTKLNQLMTKPQGQINNQEIRHLLSQVKALERDLVENPEPAAHPDVQPAQEIQPVVDPEIQLEQPIVQQAAGAPATQPVAGPAHQSEMRQVAPDLRAQALADILLSSEEDAAEPAQQQPGRKRKKPLSQLVRENHELYNNFLKKKLPKVLRELGISSSESD